MATIINLANNATHDTIVRVRSSVANNGEASLQLGSNVFHTLSVNLPLLTRAQDLTIQTELMDIGYGSQFLTTALPSDLQLTNLHGTTTQAGSTLSIVTGTATNTILVSGFSTGNTNQLVKGDFIQFVNDDANNVNQTPKVYQISNFVEATGSSPGNHRFNITLDQALVTPVTSAHEVRIGNEVEFKLMLTNKPSKNIIPQSRTSNLYTYGSFNFREVL